MDECATENSDYHIYANYRTSGCDFLGQAIRSCNLDRCHEEHVKLDLTVNDPLSEQHPLSRIRFIHRLRTQENKEGNCVINQRECHEKEYGSESHPLLKETV